MNTIPGPHVVDHARHGLDLGGWHAVVQVKGRHICLTATDARVILPVGQPPVGTPAPLDGIVALLGGAALRGAAVGGSARTTSGRLAIPPGGIVLEGSQGLRLAASTAGLFVHALSLTEGSQSTQQMWGIGGNRRAGWFPDPADLRSFPRRLEPATPGDEGSIRQVRASPRPVVATPPQSSGDRGHGVSVVLRLLRRARNEGNPPYPPSSVSGACGSDATPLGTGWCDGLIWWRTPPRTAFGEGP